MAEGGGMNKRSWAVLIIIVLGISYHVYQLVQIQEKTKVEGLDIENIGFEGSLLPAVPIPSDVKFDFILTVNNPTPYTLDIERVTYLVDIGGERLLADSLEGLEIAGLTPIKIPVKISLEKAAETILDSILSEGMEIKVSGTIDAPLKLFGVYRLLTVSIPYEKKQFVPIDVIETLDGYIGSIIESV